MQDELALMQNGIKELQIMALMPPVDKPRPWRSGRRPKWGW
jgi:hypothetical protein